MAHIGTSAEYVAAFRALKLAKHEELMLRAHANAPDRTLTSREIARAAGYDSYSSANAHYGKLGRKVAEFLDLQPLVSSSRNEPVWTMAIADGKETEHAEDIWRWQMYPEVAEALRELNMA